MEFYEKSIVNMTGIMKEGIDGVGGGMPEENDSVLFERRKVWC